MKKKLNNQYFILRHGQTIHQTRNIKLIYKWPDNPPVKLTKKGEKQIKEAAKKLKKEKIDLIYSSDIYRTRQTAGIVSKELGLKVIFDKRLRDINLGIYHGRPKKEFYQDFPNREERFYKRPSKGESWLDCRKRIISFIKYIDKKYKNKNILIISHGDPLWLLEGWAKGLADKELLRGEKKTTFPNVGELQKLN